MDNEFNLNIEHLILSLSYIGIYISLLDKQLDRVAPVMSAPSPAFPYLAFHFLSFRHFKQSTLFA